MKRQKYACAQRVQRDHHAYDIHIKHTHTTHNTQHISNTLQNGMPQKIYVQLKR